MNRTYPDGKDPLDRAQLCGGTETTIGLLKNWPWVFATLGVLVTVETS